MQPEPAQVFQNTLPRPAPELSVATSQHGLQDRNHELSLLPHHVEGQREQVSAVDTQQDASWGFSRDRDAGAAARLSPTSPSPKNRITEYENALVQTPKKRNQGPVFEVIKSARKPDDKTCSIAKLPNGESCRLSLEDMQCGS